MEKMVIGIKNKDSSQVNDIEILGRDEILKMCKVWI